MSVYTIPLSVTVRYSRHALVVSGSNNINLLDPNGQFGSRKEGGKDASAARYVSIHNLHVCACMCMYVHVLLAQLTNGLAYLNKLHTFACVLSAQRTHDRCHSLAGRAPSCEIVDDDQIAGRPHHLLEFSLGFD